MGHGTTDAVVEFATNELTATCPITSQPDFYELGLPTAQRMADRIQSPQALSVGLPRQGIFAEDLAATLSRTSSEHATHRR